MCCSAKADFKVWVVVLCLFGYAQAAPAAESLAAILAQHIVHEPIRLAYQQTRHMQLIDEPILSSGDMYISATHVILEQQKPIPMLIVTNHTKLWLYHRESGAKQVRYIRRFSNKNGALGALILALRTGELKQLNAHYQIEVETSDKAWSVVFKPLKDQVRSMFERMTLQGLAGNNAHTIDIGYRGGNRTLWSLDKRNGDSASLTATMNMLIETAGGR